MLRQNQTLIELNLSNNKIESGGAEVLAEGVGANRFLNELDLSGNDIRDAGVEALAEVLQTCALTALYLRDNGIGLPGLKALAEVLKKSIPLTKLDLHHNHIKEEDIQVLTSVFTMNHTLTYIKLTDLDRSKHRGWYDLLDLTAVVHNNSLIQIDGIFDLVTKDDPEYIWIKKGIQNNIELCRELFDAAKQGNAAKVDELLKKGVSPLAIPEGEDNMAIHWATQNGHTEAVKCLAQEMVRRNINPGVPNRHLKTTLELARINNHLEIVRILKDYEAMFRENLAQKSLIITLDKALLQPEGKTSYEIISENYLLERKADQGHQEIALKYAIWLIKNKVTGIFSQEKCLHYFALAAKGSNADLAKKAFSELSKLHFADMSRKLLGMDAPVPIKIDGLDAAAKSLAAACHLQKADECMLNENFSEALVFYRTALEFDEKNVCALLRLGMTLQKLNQLEDAKQAYQTAIKIEDKTAEKYLQQAKQKLEEIEKQLALQQPEVIPSISSQDVDREELLGKGTIPFSQNRARHQFSQKTLLRQTNIKVSASQKNLSKVTRNVTWRK